MDSRVNVGDVLHDGNGNAIAVTAVSGSSMSMSVDDDGNLHAYRDGEELFGREAVELACMFGSSMGWSILELALGQGEISE